MADSQNFDNNGQEFNIHLSTSGELLFMANDKNGAGNTRMVIGDDSGQVTIGGSGTTGAIQLRDEVGYNTIYIGGTGSEANILLGGTGPNQSGRVQLHNTAGATTVDLNGAQGALYLGADGVDGDVIVRNSAGDTTVQVDGGTGSLQMFSAAGTGRVDLQGSVGRLYLKNSSGVATADLRGDAGILTLGAAGQTDGDLNLLNTAGALTITADGESGEIVCAVLTESSDVRFKTDVAPLRDALDRVLALRGVRYQRTRGGQAEEIGFIGQEVEAVLPELTATDAEGYKSVSYTRVSAVLVEAVKEQQQLIREQAAALAEALRKIATIEARLA